MTFTALRGKTLRKRKQRAKSLKSGAAAIPTTKGYRYFSAAFHTDVESKDWSKIIKSYVRKTYPKGKAAAILKNEEWRYNRSHVAAYCYWSNLDSVDPAPEETTTWMNNFFSNLERISKEIKTEKKKEDKKKNEYVPTIQDRMREQLSTIIGDFDDMFDKNNSPPKAFEYLKKINCPQVHISKIRSYYLPIQKEFETLTSKTCPDDLKEGYVHLSKKDIKARLKWFDSLFADLDSYENVKRASRKTRTPKPKSADKLIKSLKYQKEDSTFKLASINPINIIGSEILFTFNTRYKKLTMLVSDGPLSVKGTTVTNFDTVKSFTIILRKPNDILPIITKGTIKKIDRTLENLKTKKYEANGRINPNTILLRAL